MKRLVLLALLNVAVGCKTAPAEPLRVAAAADLAHAFAELSPAFSAQSSPPVDLKLTPRPGSTTDATREIHPSAGRSVSSSVTGICTIARTS